MVVVTVTSLPRLWRRLAWGLVAVLLLLRFMGAPLSLDAFVSVLTGWAVARWWWSWPRAPPAATTIVDPRGLAEVGIPLEQLQPASVDARGSTPYFGTTADGRRYFVKVHGGDERSADLMFRVWRYLQPRNLGTRGRSRRCAGVVEHEALVATMARQFGIRTPMVAGVAAAHPNGYVLVYEAIEGRSLDELEPDEKTDDVLAQAWAQLVELRVHRIAHRDLRLANVFLGADGELFLIDFGFSELAAEDLLLQTDVAELLASSASGRRCAQSRGHGDRGGRQRHAGRRVGASGASRLSGRDAYGDEAAAGACSTSCANRRRGRSDPLEHGRRG